MRRITQIAFIVATILTVTTTAHAQVRFGVKAGITLNELKWDKEIVNKENRAGFTGGLMLEIGMPVVGLGIDASVLYAHREDDLYYDDIKLKRDFVDFPINIKYKFQLPVINKFFAPFVSTGPDFALVLGDTDKGDFKTRKWNTSWNVGFGVELFRKLQIHANYGIGITKAFKYIGKDVISEPIEGKDKLWTITAAFMF